MVGADFIPVERLFHSFAPRNENPFGHWPNFVLDVKVSKSVTKQVGRIFDISNKQALEVKWSEPIS